MTDQFHLLISEKIWKSPLKRKTNKHPTLKQKQKQRSKSSSTTGYLQIFKYEFLLKIKNGSCWVDNTPKSVLHEQGPRTYVNVLFPEWFVLVEGRVDVNIWSTEKLLVRPSQAVNVMPKSFEIVWHLWPTVLTGHFSSVEKEDTLYEWVDSNAFDLRVIRPLWWSTAMIYLRWMKTAVMTTLRRAPAINSRFGTVLALCVPGSPL